MRSPSTLSSTANLDNTPAPRTPSRSPRLPRWRSHPSRAIAPEPSVHSRTPALMRYLNSYSSRAIALSEMRP
ncbi:MAG: hypothetical protein AAFY26_13975 [Cyanobacteria bacterium J06638_22]